MQPILIEKPYEFIPPWRTGRLAKMILAGRIHQRYLKRKGIVDIECRGLDRLKQSQRSGHGIMLAPNHPRLIDPVAMCEVARQTRTPFFAMASWHLFHQRWWLTPVLRAMGAFSVNREGLDRQAIDLAVKILETAERPLLIFPEGATSRTNDRLMALMEGPAFIARTAARRRSSSRGDGGKVVIHPVGIKYLFQGDLHAACDPRLSDIEHRLTWRPDPDQPLIDRLIKIGSALLALKEMEYGLTPAPDATLRQRQDALIDRLLEPLENVWLGAPQSGPVTHRIKTLRMKIFPEMSRTELDDSERQRRWRQLEDTYLAQQIDCYPKDWIVEHPSVDRILETVEKFEEDLTDHIHPHKPMSVIVEIGQPIEVPPEKAPKGGTDPLTDQLRDRIAQLLQKLQGESRMFESAS